MQITNFRKKNRRKEYRELVTNINMFLLTSDNLRNLFWNVKSANYSKKDGVLKIGINTTKKLGTTLEKLRKISKDLSNYLFENGLTVKRQTKIEFFVDKEDEILAKIYSLIEKVQPSGSVEEEVEMAQNI